MLTRDHVWDEGWVPEDLHSRHDELQALASAIDPASYTETGPVLLAGPPGAGKTASARWVLQDLDYETDMQSALVDAWHNHHPYQAYGAILKELGRAGVVQPQTPHSALRDRVRNALPGSGVVVVLDEAEQLSDTSILPDLDAMDGVAVVAIVNDERGFRDRLQRNSVDLEFTSIQFQPYGEDVIVDILEPRAERGLDPDVYDEDTLYDVAALANGNAREAIQGLRAAAQHARDAGRSEISAADVDAGHETAVERLRQKTRSRLNRHERITLECLEEQGTAGISAIYDAYVERVGKREARTKRRVQDYLAKLESYNLVTSTGEGRGTRYRPILRDGPMASQ